MIIRRAIGYLDSFSLMALLYHRRFLISYFIYLGFITGVLQTHARKYKIPIDKLTFKFKVLNNQTMDKITGPPKVKLNSTL